MQTVNVREARRNISRLLDAVSVGEEIVIERHGKPAARLVPVPNAETKTLRFPDRNALRAKLPPAKSSSAELIREMRDERG